MSTDNLAEGPNDQRWSMVALVTILTGLLALRLTSLALNRTDLFFDEAQYWSWAQEPAFGYYSKPPLIAWIIAATTSVCGDGTLCVRLASPLIHTGTALLVALIGSALYDRRTGFWSGIVYATLPGVSFSSGIISTDVPLLFCWAAALLALTRLSRGGGYLTAVLLGLVIGAGLLAKYAMAFFVPCAAIAIACDGELRRSLDWRRLVLAAAVALAVFSPNIAWNVAHQFATVAHTADNAGWGGVPFHPEEVGAFLGAQFGVFGPVLFAVLLVVAWRYRRGVVDRRDRLLAAFSLPVIAFYVVQAFISQSVANWAAVAYVAATVLVTASLLRTAAAGWFRASLIANLALGALIAVGAATAGLMPWPLGKDPYARTLGWQGIATATRGVIERGETAGERFGTILIDDRPTLAEMMYYLSDRVEMIRAWRSGPVPKDHYELTRPFGGGEPEPVLLLSLKPDPQAILGAFAEARPIGEVAVPAGATATRTVYFYRLVGWRRDRADGLPP